MPLGKRVPVSSETTTKLLTQVARRCALCFGLDRDLSIKKGQIAHIDNDPSNCAESNLVFLCLNHHDEYDSRTSQSKGISPGEISIYKRWLIDAIGKNEHKSKTAGSTNDVDIQRRIHDATLFKKSHKILTEQHLSELIDGLRSDDSYRSESRLSLSRFEYFFSESGNQFLDDRLKLKSKKLLKNIDLLSRFLGQHFFYYPNHQPFKNPQYCLYPELNVDRNGTGNPDSMARYEQFAEKMCDIAAMVDKSYRSYRTEVKRTLFL